MTVEITDRDIAENILAPELESALYALLTKAGPIDPLRYSDQGMNLLKRAIAKEVERLGPDKMADLRRRADREISRFLGDTE